MWKRLDALLRARHPGSVVFVKVRTHTKLYHVKKRLETEENRVGNNAADFLAVKGVAMHDSNHQAIFWLDVNEQWQRRCNT